MISCMGGSWYSGGRNNSNTRDGAVDKGMRCIRDDKRKARIKSMRG